MTKIFFQFVKISQQTILLSTTVVLGTHALASDKTISIKEPYAPEVSSKEQKAADSTAIIIRRSSIDRNPGATETEPQIFEITALTAKTKYSLCDGEPFAEQKSPGLCSAFLVSPDTVATAGHCVRTISACRNLAFAFGFTITKGNTKPQFIKKQNIYYCDRIIVNGLNQSPSVDFALIKLNRKVKDRQPLPLRHTGKVSATARLSMAGHPLGLPSKVTLNGSVLNNNAPTLFKSDIDSYLGNSGSPVCSENGIVEGVLVRGKDSFSEDGECRRIKVCKDNQCRPSEVVRSSSFSNLVPQQMSESNLSKILPYDINP